jgi:hypothetical protein
VRRLLATALVGVIAAGCGSAEQGTVEGLVTSVDGDLTTVERFSVLAEGEPREFVPAADGEFAFPLPHLGEHLRSGDPVVVFWERREGTDYAVRLDDADPDAHP